jgi:DNA-binding response OmpR family regulator
VVFITAHRDRSYVEKAFELGAKGYVLKTALRTELLTAIREVIRGCIVRLCLRDGAGFAITLGHLAFRNVAFRFGDLNGFCEANEAQKPYLKP